MTRWKLGWMYDLLTGTGGEPELVIHSVTESQPPFDFGSYKVGRVELSPAGGAPAWHEALSEVFEDDDWMRALVYPVVAPERPELLTYEVRDAGREVLAFEGEAAFLAAALWSAPEHRSLIFLVSMALLTQASTSSFREWLARRHRPEWIIYLGPQAARAMGADGFQMAFLSVRTGEFSTKGKPMVRFVDLREKDNMNCRPQLKAVAALRGGENAAGLALGTTVLQAEPWIYERYTKSFRDQRKDTGSVREARQQLFDASSYAETIPRLLEREREERERVLAAEASQHLEYKVRNYFPRPIAVRWEKLAQLPPGDERIRCSLECAEHLITFVGLLSMVQVVDGHDVCWRPSSKVRSFKGGGGLYFDWGMMETLVLEGANTTASASDPLRLPFPELERLNRSPDGVLSWAEAERHLHQVRNDLSHLQRPTPAQINAFSRDVDASLEALFRSAAFIGNYPLVHVADYSMDAVTGERELCLAFHQGVGTATREEVRTTEHEVGRGAVGVADHHGMFRCLSPWIIYERNPETSMEDLFVFNRAREGEVTYISMASGAPLSKNELAGRWQRLLDESDALKEGTGH